MDFKSIQIIVVAIESILNKINEDLEAYSLRVSENGTYCLHIIAQTYITRIMQEVRRITEQAPLLTFIKTKKIQKDLFIAKLTSNDLEMDLKLAERTAQHLIQLIIKDLKAQQIRLFQDKIEGEDRLFKLKTIIKDVENYLIAIADNKIPNPFPKINDFKNKKDDGFFKSIGKFLGFGKDQDEEQKIVQEPQDNMRGIKSFTLEEVIMYYVQPGEFLKNKFNQQWTQITGVEIKKAQDIYLQNLKDIKERFQKYFKNMLEQVIAKKVSLATNVFIPEKQVSDQQFNVQCQKAMAIYLSLLLTKKWKSGVPVVLDDQQKMFVPQTQSLVAHEDLPLDLDQKYAQIIEQCIKSELISNLENFIRNFMQQIFDGLDLDLGQNLLEENELIGNLQLTMRTKTLGCDQMCPLCRRQCDQAHEGEVLQDRIHRCEEGHQIQGFGGNRHRRNNKAITYGCHELVKQDIVFWQGEDLKWKKFKEVIYNERRWDLEEKNQGAKTLNKEKNMKIWNLIGQYICEYYREQKIDIHFYQADMDAKRIGSICSTMYILMLDGSGSMSDKEKNGNTRWTNLSEAVSQFVNQIANDGLLKQNSRISFITYNNAAKVDCEDMVPDPSLTSYLKQPGGGTNFDAPLLEAKTLLEKYGKTYDSFVLVMMSDGESSYPNRGIDEIQNSEVFQKVKFKAIGYGAAGVDNTLKPMAADLRGTFEMVLEPSQLSNAFIEMIPNLYSQ